MRQIGAWRPHRNAGACARSAPEPRRFRDRSPGGRLAVMLVGAAILSGALSTSVSATDQLYILQSPSFGGNNPAAFQSAQFEKSLRDQRAASAAAAAKVTAAPDPNQQFANAIISQLNSLVARDVALKISNSKDGDAGTIQSGNVSVTYVNSDGQLNIVINTPGGSTTLALPTGD
jgi:Type VIII secretion system (T8SS), CsgF protein